MFIEIQKLKFLLKWQHGKLVKQHKMIDNLRLDKGDLEVDIKELKKQLSVYTDMDYKVLVELKKDDFIKTLISAKDEAMNKNRKLQSQYADLLTKLRKDVL